VHQHLTAGELETIRGGGQVRSVALRHLDRCVVCRRAFGQAVAPPRSRAPKPWMLAVGAALAGLVLFATPLRTVAGNFLEVFEPRTVTFVPVSLEDMRDLSRMPDLSAYGTARELVRSQDASAPDARTASALARFDVRLPTAGVRPVDAASGHIVYDGGRSAVSTSENVLHVIGPSVQQFVFSAARARAAAAAKHLLLRPMPSGLDGSALEVDLGSAVVANYLSTAPPSRAFYQKTETRPGAKLDGTPVIVAQMRAPKIFSTGVPVSVLENYLLQQPGFPPRLAAAFRALGDMSTTLPIPIPVDKAYAQPLVVDGVRGIGIGDDTGLGAAVIWQKRGILYAVAGPLAGRDVLAIADSLR
jgi:hypothetical protein